MNKIEDKLKEKLKNDFRKDETDKNILQKMLLEKSLKVEKPEKTEKNEEKEEEEEEKEEQKEEKGEDKKKVLEPFEQVKQILQEHILNFQLTNKPAEQTGKLKKIMKEINKDPGGCIDALCRFAVFLNSGGKNVDQIEEDLVKAIELLNKKKEESKELKSELKELKKNNKKLKDSVAKLEKEVKEMKESSEEGQSQLELYKHQLDSLQKTHEEDQQTIERLSEQLLALPAKYEKNGGTDDHIVDMLNKTAKELEEAKKEISKLNYNKQMLSDKLYEQSLELERLNGGSVGSGDLSSKFTEAQKIIFQLQSDKRALEDSVIQLIRQNNQLSARKGSSVGDKKMQQAQLIVQELLRERSLLEQELLDLYKVAGKKK